MDKCDGRLSDNQGTVRDVVDNQGDVLNHISYDSFGNVTGQSNPEAFFRFGYTGREFDQETGQYYYRARYFDSEIGRFISEDPISFNAGDANLYRYVFNGPTNFTDPSGLLTLFKSNPVIDGLRIAGSTSPPTMLLAGTLENVPAVRALDLDIKINAGEGFAKDAQRYWAQRYVDPSRPWYDRGGSFVAGSLASLWTCDNSDATFATLSTALAVNKAVGTPLGGTNKAVDGVLPGSCFVAGTKVLTPNGHKAIEKIIVGEAVVSANPETGEVSNHLVKKLF